MFMSAHQPVYLPWLGLLHKVEVADLFIIYDDVPYSRKMFYNRNKILGPNGPIMLSVPVTFSKNDQTNHRDIKIDNSTGWKKKHWKSIESAYQKAPFFTLYCDELKSIYDRDWDKLCELNFEILKLLMRAFGIETPLRHSSEYGLAGEKSDRVMDMCIKSSTDIYLFGSQGKDYADVEAFNRNGVIPLFQDYQHPKYSQRTSNGFEPYMSAIDLLFFHGPDSREILKSGNLDGADYVAEANRG
jgi:hypothetical protein